MYCIYMQFLYVFRTYIYLIQILCTPATSSDPERCFSLMGLIYTKLRNRLKPSNAEAYMCCKTNQYMLAGLQKGAVKMSDDEIADMIDEEYDEECTD
jgi:hypothetical protein